MSEHSVQSPVFDVTLRVGCHLVYEVAGTATLLLNVQPLRDRRHLVLAESITFGADLPVEEYVDHYGNHVYRLPLRHGSNAIHHDARVMLDCNSARLRFYSSRKILNDRAWVFSERVPAPITCYAGLNDDCLLSRTVDRCTPDIIYFNAAQIAALTESISQGR